jgi:hypothetical protein
MLPVLFNNGSVLLPVLLPVVGVAGAPFSRTVSAPFAVFGIGRDLFPVIVRTALPLALAVAAEGLAGLELRWLEELLAAKATPFTHTGGCLIEESLGARRTFGI